MKKGLNKIIGLVIAATVVSLSSAIAVYAASAESNTRTASANGYNYEFTASVHNNSTSTWAYTNLSNSNGNNVPTGYMGVLPRLYNSSGTLIKSGGWTYNDAAAAGMAMSSGTTSTRGTYYSFGQVKLYNGSGYNTYDTYSSPVVSNSSSKAQESKIKIDTNYYINENGETYGTGFSAITLGKEPDLIAAYGIDGTFGYVRSADFEQEEPTTPEEAISQQNNNT